MAVQFQSAQRRAFWTSLLFSSAVDYLIAYGIIFALGIRDGIALWALVWALAFQTVVAIYALLNAGKRIAWYYFFEREGRIAAVASDILRHRMPPPEAYYNDADDYLYKAAMAPQTSANGRLYAGMILGALAVQRMVGPRVEAFLTAMTVEAALQRIPAREDDDVPNGTFETESDPTSFDFGFDIDPPDPADRPRR